jgi:predicted dithiol-disulfide oxidoreductase (DUF899 family)
MAFEFTRLPESDEYRKLRDELRLAEIELIEHRERVAQLRRALPPGPVLDDYEFLEGPTRLEDGDAPARTVWLSELCGPPGRALVIYHLMYGKAQTTPCPMCTMWIDGFNGVARHLAPNFDFAIAAAADLPALRAHARNRGWNQLRLLSCGDNTFKYDLHSEDEHGGQDSSISVLERDADGSVHHRYSARPRIADEIAERGIDALVATYNLMDLTPEGRGEFYAQLTYD